MVPPQKKKKQERNSQVVQFLIKVFSFGYSYFLGACTVLVGEVLICGSQQKLMITEKFFLFINKSQHGECISLQHQHF